MRRPFSELDAHIANYLEAGLRVLGVASNHLSLTGRILPMEFLVEIDVSLPPALDTDSRRELQAAEFERGSVLARDGVIRAIWRVPGRLANCGIWTMPDATAL